MSSASGNLTSTDYLLCVGADLHAEGDLQETPLISACMFGHLNMVKLLVERGAKINHRISGGFVIHFCCYLKQV